MNKSRFILLGAGCVALAVCLWQYEQYREIEAKHKRMQAVCNSLRSTERAMEKHRSEVMEMSRNVQSLRAGNKSKEEEIKRMQGRIQSLDIEVREKSDDLSKKRSLFERNRDLKQIIQRVENESVSYGDRVYKDHLRALLHMIVDGWDVNIAWPDSGGMTALHYASLLDLSYVRSWLIEHGANVLARTDDGITPRELFLREKRRTDPQWKSEKMSLFERDGDLKWIIQRLENESVRYENRVYKDHLRALLRMIVEGWDVNIAWPDSGGMTALHYASLLDLSYVRNWLIEHGANVLARTDGGITPRELFLREKRRTDPQWKTRGDSEKNISSTPLWESGTSYPGSEGMSKSSQEDTAAIRQGENTLSTISTSPSMGQTHTDLQPMIDRMRALRCREATSALYQRRLLTLLPMIRDGADVDVTLPETKGNTALHYSCAIGSWSITKWLVEHGANVNAVTDKGATPLDCVGDDNAQRIRALLISRGARRNK